MLPNHPQYLFTFLQYLQQHPEKAVPLRFTTKAEATQAKHEFRALKDTLQKAIARPEYSAELRPILELLEKYKLVVSGTTLTFHPPEHTPTAIAIYNAISTSTSTSTQSE